LVAVIGVAWFGEPIGVIRALALVMIVSGVVIVNLSR
jgi:multidrug transporter EmrE-like cation transporter